MDDAPQSPPLRKRGWIWLQAHWGSIVLGAVGLLGFTCVAVGLAVAAGEGDSTVVVIAGVVLVALALLGPDIEQAEVTGRNWAAAFRRTTAKVDRLSATPDVPNAVRKQLEELKFEVVELTRAGSRREPPAPRRRIRRSTRATEYVTFHTWGGGDEFDVTLVGADGEIYGARCEVIGPNGLTTFAPSDPLKALIPVGDTVTYTYPKDFAQAPPLTKGRYTYRWSLPNATANGGLPVTAGAFDYRGSF